MAKSFKIESLGISTNPAGEDKNPDFNGYMTLDVKKGEFNVTTNDMAFSRAGHSEFGHDIEFATVPGKNGRPAYFCALPRSLKAGEKIYIYLVNEGSGDLGYCIKELTVPEGGINFEAGKITTLNVNVKRGDMGYGGLIDINQIDEESLEDEIYFCSKNNINSLALTHSFVTAKGIEFLRKILSKPVTEQTPAINLDLKLINLKAGDETYTGADNKQVKIDADNTVTENMFYNLPRLKSLILPNRIVGIRKNAIGNNINLESITIESMTTPVIEEGAIGMTEPGEGEKRELYIDFNGAQNKVSCNFMNCETNYIDLFISDLWSRYFQESPEHWLKPDEKFWKNMTWKSVTVFNH